MAKEKKIGGLDEWDVKNDYDTVVRAREVLGDDKKVAAVKLYAKKRLAAEKEAAAQIDLETSVGGKLSTVFGGKK